MMKYEGVATLGVNLNRQKYGPLDVSSVILTIDDLIAYCAGDADAMSEGWTGGTPYPYPGQIIVVLSDNTAYLLYEEEGAIQNRAMIDLSNFYSKSQIDEMLGNVSVDMSDYYNKEQIDALISAIEGTGEGVVVAALTEDEILAITGSYEGSATDSVSGQVLTEMTAEDVQEIVKNI